MFVAGPWWRRVRGVEARDPIGVNHVNETGGWYGRTVCSRSDAHARSTARFRLRYDELPEAPWDTALKRPSVAARGNGRPAAGAYPWCRTYRARRRRRGGAALDKGGVLGRRHTTRVGRQAVSPMGRRGVLRHQDIGARKPDREPSVARRETSDSAAPSRPYPKPCPPNGTGVER